jgi:hypothetical protein
MGKQNADQHWQAASCCLLKPNPAPQHPRRPLISAPLPPTPSLLPSKDPNPEKAKELQKQLKLGLVECLNHGLLHAYPVLHEKTGELVAQVRRLTGWLLLRVWPAGASHMHSAPACG